MWGTKKRSVVVLDVCGAACTYFLCVVSLPILWISTVNDCLSQNRPLVKNAPWLVWAEIVVHACMCVYARTNICTGLQQQQLSPRCAVVAYFIVISNQSTTVICSELKNLKTWRYSFDQWPFPSNFTPCVYGTVSSEVSCCRWYVSLALKFGRRSLGLLPWWSNFFSTRDGYTDVL